MVSGWQHKNEDLSSNPRAHLTKIQFNLKKLGIVMCAYNLHTGKIQTGDSLKVAGQPAHLARELARVQCESVSEKQGGLCPRNDKVCFLASKLMHIHMQMNTHT